MPTIKAVICGGPDDGQTFTLQAPAPLMLHVPAERQTIVSWSDGPGGRPADVEWPRDRVYHLGPHPLEGETAEYYPDEELATVARRCPSVRRWRRVKDCRFVGEFELPHFPGAVGVALAANVPDGRTFSWKQVVGSDDQPPMEWLWEKFEYEVEYELTPPCAVPDCDGKGLVVMTAMEQGRLAGRSWEPGDKIRLCPEHSHDVIRVCPGGDDNLPEWLERDARDWIGGSVIMKLNNGQMNCGGIGTHFG